MPIARLPKGSKEVMYIAVDDRQGQLANLDTATITWQVWDNFDDVDLGTPIAIGNCTNEGMTAITSPIDTTLWNEGVYRLFISMTMGSEIIKLGPFDFVVG
jgi:hypothetical protein